MSIKRKGTALFVLLVLCGLTPAAAVQPERTPIPRDPRPDFSQMQVLMGSWNCSVASSRRPRPFHTHVTASVSTDGYWMVRRTITDPVPWNPIRITTTEYLTYDGTTARWIDLGMDDYGAYDVSSSPGWRGASMTWTEIAYPKFHGVVANEPRIVTKLNDTQTVENTALVETNGTRVTVRTACTKQP